MSPSITLVDCGRMPVTLSTPEDNKASDVGRIAASVIDGEADYNGREPLLVSEGTSRGSLEVLIRLVPEANRLTMVRSHSAPERSLQSRDDHDATAYRPESQYDVTETTAG